MKKYTAHRKVLGLSRGDFVVTVEEHPGYEALVKNGHMTVEDTDVAAPAVVETPVEAPVTGDTGNVQEPVVEEVQGDDSGTGRPERPHEPAEPASRSRGRSRPGTDPSGNKGAEPGSEALPS